MERSDVETGPRVLLVESDLFFAARLLAGLTKLGYWVERAWTEKQALELSEELKPELAIVNLASAKIDGLTLARKLKADRGVPRVLAYYSHVKIPEIREQALAAGIDKLVPNSAITQRLETVLRSVMGDTSADHELEAEVAEHE